MSQGGEFITINGLCKAHNEQMRAIVEDDHRFREFQAKIRNESLYTNIAVAMTLHKSTYEVILSEEHNFLSNPTTSSVKNENSTDSFPCKAFQPLRRFSRYLSQGNSLFDAITQACDYFQRRCRAELIPARNVCYNIQNTWASEQWRNAAPSMTNFSWSEPANKSYNIVSKGTTVSHRQYTRKYDKYNIPPDMNLHDIKYMSREDLRKLCGNECRKGTCTPAAHSNVGKQIFSKKINKVGVVQLNSSFQKTDERARKQCVGSVMDDATYSNVKKSLWTEDTVQYLYEETICGHKVHFWSAETYAALKHSDDNILHDI